MSSPFPPRSCAVILSTYNSPALLEKVLWGYTVQSTSRFSIVVADDGSGPQTQQLIQNFQQRGQLQIQHIWHEDRGFRKTEILNRAIMATEADFLIFSDGDCIPTPTFVADHQRLCTPGTFVAGTLLRLSAAATAAVDEEAIQSGRVFSARWLWTHGQPLDWKSLRYAGSRLLGSFLNATSPTQLYWCGGNASGWRRDIVAVNGFDEGMAYGGEDKEFGQRLINLGIRPVSGRNTVQCLHLDHGRSYVDPEKRVRNREQIAVVRLERRTWTANGIEKRSAVPQRRVA